MIKLYEIEMTVYVMAKNKVEAHEAATGFDVDIPIEDCEINEVDAVKLSWLDALPYGANDNKTCREILDV